MSLNIKSEETHRLAKELASETGESMSQAVTIAIKQRLDAIRSGSPEEIAKKLMAIGSNCEGRWKEPWTSLEHGEILYDEFGLPK